MQLKTGRQPIVPPPALASLEQGASAQSKHAESSTPDLPALPPPGLPPLPGPPPSPPSSSSSSLCSAGNTQAEKQKLRSSTRTTDDSSIRAIAVPSPVPNPSLPGYEEETRGVPRTSRARRFFLALGGGFFQK